MTRVYLPSILEQKDQISLVEKLFPDPDTVSEGEYITIYEFLRSPDICNDPAMISGCLEEFVGWAQYMLKEMSKQGRSEQKRDISHAPSGTAA